MSLPTLVLFLGKMLVLFPCVGMLIGCGIGIFMGVTQPSSQNTDRLVVESLMFTVDTAFLLWFFQPIDFGTVPGDLCTLATLLEQSSDTIEKVVGTVVPTLGGLIFGVTAPDVTAGWLILRWSISMATARFSLCEGGLLTDVDAQTKLKRDRDSLLGRILGGSNGALFTSEKPQGREVGAKGRSCIPYPRHAGWCSRLGHSHQVDSTFQDPNFAKLRALNVQMTWERIQRETTLQTMSETSPVCELSIQDALCIDAFPPCNPDDLTPCMIACRNVKICFQTLFIPKGVNSTAKEMMKRQLAENLRGCEKLCKMSTISYLQSVETNQQSEL